jgi:ubiquinone/menaquinone biosynthesis C-methylase UbiE
MRRPTAIVALLLWLSAAAAAQIASRPAEEWVKVLDGAERLAGLRIPDVVAALKLQPGNVVADLGAGSGPFIPAFATRVGPSGKVYAVEIDKGFFPYIERRAKEAGVANVRTVAGEFTDPKLPAADVDVAFMHDVLHHVENREAYIKNLVRYLKPGARVAIIDYHPAQSPHANEPALQVSKEQASAWLTAAGLKPVQDVALFPDKWFVVFGR